jgi:hypothetical protein
MEELGERAASLSPRTSTIVDDARACYRPQFTCSPTVTSEDASTRYETPGLRAPLLFLTELVSRTRRDHGVAAQALAGESPS